MATCPYCGKYKQRRDEMFEHMNQYHGDELNKSGMDAAQALYNSTHGTIHGRCMVCGNPTDWNESTGKPYKLCNNPNCRKQLKAQYDKNLMNARGIDQHTLMGNVEHQKAMMANRKIAGMYEFADGGKVEYVGSLEQAFLKFCDQTLELKSSQVLPAPESFEYYDTKDRVRRSYIPDYYLPDYNLIVEVKDAGNGNPAFQEETRYKVDMKDAVMRKQTKYNYIRISGTNYGKFLKILFNITHGPDKDEKTNQIYYVISESANGRPVTETENLYLITGDTGYGITEAAVTIGNNLWLTLDPISSKVVMKAGRPGGITRQFKYIGDMRLAKLAIGDLIETAINGSIKYTSIPQALSKFSIDCGQIYPNAAHKSNFIEMSALPKF